MNIPKEELEYALKKLEEKGVNLNEGGLKDMLIEAIDEYYTTNPQHIADLLPPVDAVIQVQYPAKFISDISELRRKLPRIPVDGEEATIGKMGVNVILKVIDDNSVILSDNISEFDLLVYSSICTWIDSGIGATAHEIAREKRFFTPGIIYKNFNPASVDDGRFTETSEEVEEVRKSIDKLRHIQIKLNYKGFINNAKNVKKAEKEERIEVHATKEDWFLNAAKKTVKVNGQVLYGYELNTVPPMYWQSKQVVKQLATYDRRLLVTPKIKDTSRSAVLAVLKHELLGHIQTLKKNPKLSRKLKYDTLFERCGIEVKDKHERKRRRDQIKKFLESLQLQGEISGFTEYKSGQTLAGIELKL